jgi:hypothetical protein
MPVRSELAWLLVTLDKEHTKASPSTRGRSGMRSERCNISQRVPARSSPQPITYVLAQVVRRY